MNYCNDFQPSNSERDPIEAKKVIVYLTSLLQIFSICRTVNCGSCVEQHNIKVIPNGAMIKVKTLCNDHHEMEWESSPSVGFGKKRVPVINVLIAAYCLLTGLHIKQVGNR